MDWEICKQDGLIIGKGSFPNAKFKNEGWIKVGELQEERRSIRQAERLNVNLTISDNEYAYTYPV